eukprot:1746129-Alexandrium_andersonii.AAC.1
MGGGRKATWWPKQGFRPRRSLLSFPFISSQHLAQLCSLLGSADHAALALEGVHEEERAHLLA